MNNFAARNSVAPETLRNWVKSYYENADIDSSCLDDNHSIVKRPRRQRSNNLYSIFTEAATERNQQSSDFVSSSLRSSRPPCINRVDDIIQVIRSLDSKDDFDKIQHELDQARVINQQLWNAVNLHNDLDFQTLDDVNFLSLEDGNPQLPIEIDTSTTIGAEVSRPVDVNIEEFSQSSDINLRAVEDPGATSQNHSNPEEPAEQGQGANNDNSSDNSSDNSEQFCIQHEHHSVCHLDLVRTRGPSPVPDFVDQSQISLGQDDQAQIYSPHINPEIFQCINIRTWIDNRLHGYSVSNPYKVLIQTESQSYGKTDIDTVIAIIGDQILAGQDISPFLRVCSILFELLVSSNQHDVYYHSTNPNGCCAFIVEAQLELLASDSQADFSSIALNQLDSVQGFKDLLKKTGMDGEAGIRMI